MTRSQLMAKYDNNADAVDAIIQEKSQPALAKTCVKPHPDAPTCAAP